MAKRPQVTVLGSLNMDISVTVPRLPGPGATVVGGAARFTPGGKGANQAVAAARLGAEVRMVGCVGDDEFGRRLLASLRAEGINADAVRVAANTPTGLAMIAVDESGENLITVAPGANHQVGAPDVAAATANERDILVISAEIPISAITQVLADAHRAGAHGAPCVLNLAPAPETAADLVAAAGADLDWLVVNESEAAAILGHPVSGLAAAAKAAAELTAPGREGREDRDGRDGREGGESREGREGREDRNNREGNGRQGPRHAVVTAGAAGAALADSDGTHVIDGFPVHAVDTVGAGDTFVGALAVAIAAGVPAPDAVSAAAAAGAAAVTRHGAQTAMPRPADVLAATGVTWPVS
jgi:ribokinase